MGFFFWVLLFVTGLLIGSNKGFDMAIVALTLLKESARFPRARGDRSVFLSPISTQSKKIV